MSLLDKLLDRLRGPKEELEGGQEREERGRKLGVMRKRCHSQNEVERDEKINTNKKEIKLFMIISEPKKKKKGQFERGGL